MTIPERQSVRWSFSPHPIYAHTMSFWWASYGGKLNDWTLGLHVCVRVCFGGEAEPLCQLASLPLWVPKNQIVPSFACSSCLVRHRSLFPSPCSFSSPNAQHVIQALRTHARTPTLTSFSHCVWRALWRDPASLSYFHFLAWLVLSRHFSESTKEAFHVHTAA